MTVLISSHVTTGLLYTTLSLTTTNIMKVISRTIEMVPMITAHGIAGLKGIQMI